MRRINMSFVITEAEHATIRDILGNVRNHHIIEETNLYIKLSHPEKPNSFYLIYAQNGAICFPPELEGPITTLIAKNFIPYTIRHCTCQGYEAFEKALIEFDLTPLPFY